MKSRFSIVFRTGGCRGGGMVECWRGGYGAWVRWVRCMGAVYGCSGCGTVHGCVLYVNAPHCTHHTLPPYRLYRTMYKNTCTRCTVPYVPNAPYQINPCENPKLVDRNCFSLWHIMSNRKHAMWNKKHAMWNTKHDICKHIPYFEKWPNVSWMEPSLRNLSEPNVSWTKPSLRNLSEPNVSWMEPSLRNLSEPNVSWMEPSLRNLSEPNVSWTKPSLRNLSEPNVSWMEPSLRNLSEPNVSWMEPWLRNLSEPNVSWITLGT